MKLENRLYSLELDINMISFKIGLIIEDLEDEIFIRAEEGKSAEEEIKQLASLQATRDSLIKLAEKRISDLRLKNE